MLRFELARLRRIRDDVHDIYETETALSEAVDGMINDLEDAAVQGML